MKYYKLLNKNETHYGFKFKTGLNVDTVSFNPSGRCLSGGIYYSSKDILALLYIHDHWIREVTIPDDAKTYKDSGIPEKWKADKVILGKRKRVTLKIIRNLIAEGIDVHAYNDNALRWAIDRGHAGIVKLLKRYVCKLNSHTERV